MIRLPDIPGLQGQAVNSPTANATMGRSQTAAAGPQMQAQTIRPQGVDAQSIRAVQQADPAMARKAPDASFVERRDILPTGRGAQAAAAGLGKIGDAIMGVGQQFTAVALDAQRQENARLESSGRLSLVGAKAQFDLELENEMDPAARIERTRKFYEDQRTLLDDMDAPDIVRASLGEFHTVEALKGNIRAGGDAANLTKRNTVAQLDMEMEKAVEAGDDGLFNRTLSSRISAGLMTPGEAVAAKQAYDKQKGEKALVQTIMADPVSWQEANPASTVPPGVTPAKWLDLQTFARGAVRQRTEEATGAVLDAMASNKDLTLEEVDAATADLRPKVREDLRNEYLKRQKSDYNATIETPAYQEELYGRINAALRDYNPDAEDSDSQVGRLDIMLRELKPGFQKDSIEKRFKAKDSVTEAKDYGEYVLKQVDNLHKNGYFGKKAEPGKIGTQDVVADGFLKDTAKLQRLGFSFDPKDSDSQAAQIKAAAEKDPALGQRKFIELWDKRPGGSVMADDIEIYAANALRLGHPSINWNASGEEDAANAANFSTERKYGIAKTKLEEFIRLNPDAKPADIDAQYKRITGESIKDDAKRKASLIPARPGSGGGETSMRLPDKLKPLAATFTAEADKHGLDPRFLAAISMHETANGTSSAFRNKNNAMGVSNSSGPISFADSADSIARMARVLASGNGPYKSARTVAEIAKIYAPAGADNDPGDLNKYWTNSVSKYLRQLGGDPDKIFVDL